MNLAVRLYSDASESELSSFPAILPSDWPIEVRELGESTTLPSGNWALMTCAEYEQWRADHMAAYLSAIGGG